MEILDLENELLKKKSRYDSLPPMEAYSPGGCYLLSEINTLNYQLCFLKGEKVKFFDVEHLYGTKKY